MTLKSLSSPEMEIAQACSRCAVRPWFAPILSPFHFPKPPSLSFVYSKHGILCTSSSAATSGARAEPGSGKAAVQSQTDRSSAIKKRASDLSADLKGTSIFLVGVSSSCKSALGRILADSLRYFYFDSDNLVEEAAGGRQAAMSLLEKDKDGYLASETEVLKQLSSMGRLVVNAGNGAVKSAINLALIRHGISIWVDVPLDLLSEDIAKDRIHLSAFDMATSTPLPDSHSLEHFRDQLAAVYEDARHGYSTADATISLQRVASLLGHDELSAVTVEDLCMETLKEIEKLLRVKKMMEEAARPF